MKLLEHPASIALGVSTVCLVSAAVYFFPPSYYVVYHSSESVLPLFASVAIDWILCWLVVTAVLTLARRYRVLERPIWGGIIALLPWMLLEDCKLLAIWSMPRWLSIAVLVLPGAALLCLFAFRRAAFPPIFVRLRRFAAGMLGFVAVLGVIILIEFAWFAWEARNPNLPIQASHQASARVDGAHRPKVIWILLDELSYRQVFERRFPGLGLPTFDRLAAQSTVFTHVIPAGNLTQYVVPSLFTGLAVDDFRVSANGRLRSLHDHASNTWRPFDPRQTVFEDANQAGYMSGLAGWHNPYCRILSEVVDPCFWASRIPLPDYLQPDASFKAQMSNPFLFLASRLLRTAGARDSTIVRDMASRSAERHLEDYKDIRGAADKLLMDPSLDFIFLHLPVPHPGGIYDRKRMSFTTMNASYIDNLALADQDLAQTRAILEQRQQWDDACVIVMGDHSWRTTEFWSSDPSWTSEDQQASDGGKFDDRPAYIVKMPGQESALRVDTRFRALETRALLDGIFSGKLRTAEDLQRWASTRP